MSILTGKSSPPRARTEQPDERADGVKAIIGAMDLLKAELERKSTEADAARADAASARAEATLERDKVESMRALLAQEADTRANAQAQLAAALADCEGLRAQLVAARSALEEKQESLAQAIAVAGEKQPINIPAHEPPTYELEVVMRDASSRTQKVVMKPIKAQS